MCFTLRAGLALLLGVFVTSLVNATPIHINKLHYDNAGTDSGEFIELAGAAGSVLDGWTLVLYNGASGSPYDSLSLLGTLSDDTGTGFGFEVVDLPSNGLQNGVADGIALLDDAGALVEFLSYEGVLIATDGPAAGQTSRDIIVSESNATPLGWSLQLSGSGNLASDFVWQPAQAATPGATNQGQLMIASSELPLPSIVLLMLAGLMAMSARRATIA